MSEKEGAISRRKFLAYTVAAGAGVAALRAFSRCERSFHLKGRADNALIPGLAVIHGSAFSPAEEKEIVTAMTRRAVDALGGMQNLVRPGDRVVIKPNMAWVRPPQAAATTNPWVVAALVQMCIEAGAGRVKVMDHTIPPNPQPSYQASGIAKAAAQVGAEVVYVDKSCFLELDVPDGYALASWPFYEEVVSADLCDVLINVPVLKHHGTSRLTMALKNVFGMVGGERGTLHRDIHRKIADLNRVVKVDLTVLDAYRVMRRHGPSGGRPEDVDNSPQGARRIIAGTDPVAVDAYGASLFGYQPEDIGFIRFAAEAQLGSADWQSALKAEEDIA